MATLKKFPTLPYSRPLKGMAFALILAIVMNFYFTQIAPDSRISSLANNSKSPLLLMFCFSLMVTCVGALRGDIFDWFSGKKTLSPEQMGMIGMILLSGTIFAALVIFQDCREAEIEFQVTQAGKINVLQPGEAFIASTNSGVTLEAKNLADPAASLDCLWNSSVDGVKILSPEQCQTLVKSEKPGPMILTLVARPPRCSSRFLAPLTMIWQ
ncbi:MAG: hypothetical protein EHM21_00540 [Chloroflexi bacterium]|nr:MAG: hypothetical protein EHM21_00540 [Chloroflexota bacterium]